MFHQIGQERKKCSARQLNAQLRLCDAAVCLRLCDAAVRLCGAKAKKHITTVPFQDIVPQAAGATICPQGAGQRRSKIFISNQDRSH
jgi:hypothetical protein